MNLEIYFLEIISFNILEINKILRMKKLIIEVIMVERCRDLW